MAPPLSVSRLDPGADFVIETALPEELAAVLAYLPGYRELPPREDDIRTYYQCNLPVTFADNSTGNYRVIVTRLLSMGRVDATATTADAIRRWKPRHVILVGIAGGIAARTVKIGDILISDQVVDYELQKILPSGPEIRWEAYQVDARLLNASKGFRDDRWKDHLKVSRPDNDTPNIHVGPIASGDKVIAFSKILGKYQSSWPKLIGVEMEASGAALAASQSPHKPGFFMVRSVSDLADANKDSVGVQEWRSYACHLAAAFTIAFLKSGPVPCTDKHSGISITFEVGSPVKPLWMPSVDITTRADAGDDRSPAVLMWLKMVRLTENPFSYQNAENDPWISRCFVSFPELEKIKPKELLIHDQKAWIFFGGAGSGKTAIRKFIAAQGRPLKQNADLICLEYDRARFKEMLSEIDNISHLNDHFVRSVHEIRDKLPSDTPKRTDVKRILCLIDPGAEPIPWKGRSITAASLVAMLLSLPKDDDISFRFFLSTETQNELVRSSAVFSQNQCKLVPIKWDEPSLKNLIAERMRIFSYDQVAPYRSLGELCEDERIFPRSIDIEIAREAGGSPRFAVSRANTYLMEMQKIHIKSRLSLLEEVQKALSRLSKRPGSIVMSFWGSKGIGKTTLLRRFSTYLGETGGIKRAEIWDVEKLTLGQIEDLVQQAVAEISSDEILVILIDNIDQLLRRDKESKAFFEFEQIIMDPIVLQERVLFLVTSQIELIQWREHDVRLRQVNHCIPTLTIDEVKKLASDVGLDAGTVHHFTFGQPQVMSWLLENPSLSEKELAARSWEYFLEDISERAGEIGEIICLLPVFNIFLLRRVLNNDSLDDSEYLDCLEWIKEYIRRGIIRWDVSIGSYRFIDSAVRRLLARRVWYEKPEKYREIQQIAAEYFSNEARSPAYLHMHLVSAIYHRAKSKSEWTFERVGAECLQWIQSNKPLWLSARWDEISNAWESGAGEVAVSTEIKDLIGPHYFELIMQEIEEIKRMTEAIV